MEKITDYWPFGCFELIQRGNISFRNLFHLQSNVSLFSSVQYFLFNKRNEHAKIYFKCTESVNYWAWPWSIVGKSLCLQYQHHVWSSTHVLVFHTQSISGKGPATHIRDLDRGPISWLWPAHLWLCGPLYSEPADGICYLHLFVSPCLSLIYSK